MYTVFGAKVVDDKDDVAYKEQHSPLQGVCLASAKFQQRNINCNISVKIRNNYSKTIAFSKYYYYHYT